jgi:hypothetical protein
MGNGPARTLSDGDIATRHRRPGPDGATGGGTDADAHAHTDSDAAPSVTPTATDADSVTDQDTGGH